MNRPRQPKSSGVPESSYVLPTTLPAELDTLENAPAVFLQNYGKRIKRWRASEINLYFYFDLWCSRYGPELERRRRLGEVI